MSKNGKGLTGFYEKLPPSLIKKNNVTLFPEGAIGYLVGPTMALLANSNPIGTIFSSLFISYIQVGGSAMQPNFSSESTDIIIAVIIYLAAFALLMKGVITGILKKTMKSGDDKEAKA